MFSTLILLRVLRIDSKVNNNTKKTKIITGGMIYTLGKAFLASEDPINAEVRYDVDTVSFKPTIKQIIIIIIITIIINYMYFLIF